VLMSANLKLLSFIILASSVAASLLPALVLCCGFFVVFESSAQTSSGITSLRTALWSLVHVQRND